MNGEPVFIRGGNWIVSDGLLRLSEKRYKSDIDFHGDMNLNMIRCWAGGITERPEFYKNCDRRGILVSSSTFSEFSASMLQMLTERMKNDCLCNCRYGKSSG